MGFDDPLINKMHIKMSGCPNGCSQHHIANIGLYGASIKAGERTIPAYIAHLGGEYDSGEVAFGTRLKSRLPAKRVPDAIERILRHYQESRESEEEFNSFVARQEKGHFEDLLTDLALPEKFSLESMNHFIDWNRSEPYQVIRGEGECAV